MEERETENNREKKKRDVKLVKKTDKRKDGLTERKREIERGREEEREKD